MKSQKKILQVLLKHSISFFPPNNNIMSNEKFFIFYLFIYYFYFILFYFIFFFFETLKSICGHRSKDFKIHFSL